MTTYLAFRHRSAVVLVANRGDDGSEFVRHLHHHARRLDMGRQGGGAADLALTILAHHLGLSRKVADWRGHLGALAWHSHGALMRRVTGTPDHVEGFEISSDNLDRFLEPRRRALEQLGGVSHDAGCAGGRGAAEKRDEHSAAPHVEWAP